MDWTIEPGTEADLPAVRALLSAAHLPEAALGRHVENLLVARAGGRVVGAAAVEAYPPVGLLRSVVVDEPLRGRGLGAALAHRAIDLAGDRGVDDLYLLTTTAEGFFERFGFTVIPRSDAPPAIAATEEFREACPEGATLLFNRLEP